MASFSKQHLFWLLLLVIIAPTFTYPIITQRRVIDSFFQPKTTVVIFNNLGGDDLTIHCKSKNDDLGTHVIYNNQNYEWKFRPNFWGTTLFFCHFSWVGGAGTYDIYKATRDHNGNRCRHECDWFVTKNGIEGYSEKNKYLGVKREKDIVFLWQSS